MNKNTNSNRYMNRSHRYRQLTDYSNVALCSVGDCTVRYSTGLVHVPISCMPNRDQVIMPTKGTTYDPTVSGVGWSGEGWGEGGRDSVKGER